MLAINLQDRVAVITGVSSGIGAGIAEVLAKAGCDVAGCGFSSSQSDGALAFIASVETHGRKALYVQCDVREESEIEIFVIQAVAQFGKIDILISNAGRNVFKGAEKCTLDEWEDNSKLNFRSHWLVSKFCKPYLEESKAGFVLIMTSNHAYSTIPGCFPYNTTKSALLGLVNALAIEWGPRVRVVGLAPGFIETKGGETWFNTFENPEAEKQKTINNHPAGTLGSVTDVGAFCAFLASEYAKFITGVTYVMDGGRSALMQDN